MPAINTRPPQRDAQRPIRIITAENRYEYDRSKQPSHMTYEWRIHSVMGAVAMEQKIADVQNQWVSVPAGRHPELSGSKDAADQAEIIRGGLILMERPKELTAQSRMLDSRAAEEQIETQFRRLQLDGNKVKVERKMVPVTEED